MADAIFSARLLNACLRNADIIAMASELLTVTSPDSFNSIEVPDTVMPCKVTLRDEAGRYRVPPHSIVMLAVPSPLIETGAGSAPSASPPQRTDVGAIEFLRPILARPLHRGPSRIVYDEDRPFGHAAKPRL